MATIEQMLPSAKDRLATLKDVALTLAHSGNLTDVQLTDIESDGRWITKKKNMIIHSMETYDAAIRESAERPQISIHSNKRKLPTVGKNSNQKRVKGPTLGMRGLGGR